MPHIEEDNSWREISTLDFSVSDLYKGNIIFERDSWEKYFENPLKQNYSIVNITHEFKKSKSKVNIIEPNNAIYYTIRQKSGKTVSFKALFQFMRNLSPQKKFWLAFKSQIDRNFEHSHTIEGVKGFSLGTIQKFTQFNEHYCCSISKQQLNCEFNHGKKQLNLSWKYMTKTQKMIYNIRLDYKMIHRIIISSNSSEEIALYIHFKFPPLVFKNWDRITSIPDIGLTKSVLEGATMLKIILPEKPYVYNIFSRLQKKGSLDMIISPMTDIKGFGELIDFSCLLETQCFNCAYAWMLIFNRFLDFVDQYMEDPIRNHQLLANFMDKEKQNHLAFQKTLESIFHSINSGNLFFLFKALDGQFNLYQDFQPILPPKGMSYLRKVILTPTKIFFLPPQQHSENRIIRNYDADFFLQVVLKEDNMGKITNSIENKKNCVEFMNENFSIKEGIRIKDRLFTFLACSNSQLREHSFWMYAEDNEGNTSEVIRRGIGFEDMSGTPSKVLSRMGLCFSTSSRGHHLKSYGVEQDIISTCGNYNFSDGIGRISSDQAIELWGTKSSAAQIRFMGFKGMLCIDPTLKGKQTLFRKSMKKFEYRGNSTIEILKVSEQRPLYLNRQLIALLEDKGIVAKNFMNLQKEMILRSLFGLLKEEYCYDILKCQQFIDCKELDMIRDNQISFLTEPFFRSIILSIIINNFNLLLHKARIYIPLENGRNMFGVLDEYQVLEPGQVFVKYTTNGSTKILKGKVVVTKNPCMDPGNVKVLTAVDNPKVRSKLQHIKDCIVFPSKGERPVINEMSGADLDGDEYIVLWDQNLIFSETQNKEGLDYSSQKKTNAMPKRVTKEDLIDFIFKFVSIDNVGKCANSHLAYSDHQGFESKESKHLAQIYPAKLDFLKHGDNEKNNDTVFPPCKYPDFMMKTHYKNSYRSKNVLGSLYRKAKIFQCSIYNAVSFTSSNVASDPLFEVEGWQKFEEEAKKELENFNYNLHAILSPYGFSSIEESLSSTNANINFLSDANDKDGVRTHIDKSIRDLCQVYNRKFSEYCLCDRITSPSEREINKFRRASAWYMVTYRENSYSLLFPWCIAYVLCNIHSRNRSQRRLSNSPIIFENMEHEIQNTDLPDLHILFKWADYHKLLTKYKDDLVKLICYYANIVEHNGIQNISVMSKLMFFFEWISFDTTLRNVKSCDQLFLNKLQKVAAYTLVMIHLTLDLKYLGIREGEEQELSEGETLKIMGTDELWTLFNTSSKINLLKRWSGVKDIICNRDKTTSIFFKAYGLKWQLCVFEEIIYNDNLAIALSCEDDSVLVF